MSEALGVESILGQARSQEREYDWIGAVESYKKALGLVSETDFLKMGQVHERIGYAFHRGAMQAESVEQVRERMQRAIEAYEKAREFYERLIDKQKAARVFRCDAIAKYLGYWLTSDPSEKRRLLDGCLELEGKALAAFLESGDMVEYGKTYNELPLVFFCRCHLEWNRQTFRSIVDRGMQWGEKAVAALSELGDSYEVARAYLAFAICAFFFYDFFVAEPEEMDRIRLRIVQYLGKTAEISEKVGDAHLLGMSHIWLGLSTGGTSSGGREAVNHFQKTLECGKLTRDNFLVASGLDFLAYTTYWKAIATEDPEKRRELAEKAMQFYDEGQHHYSKVSFINPRGGIIAPPSGYAEYYFNLAEWGTDPNERLGFLEKAEKAGIEALKEAEASDIPLAVVSALHVVSKTFEARAYVEPDPAEKRSRLEKALKYREKTIETYDQLIPFEYFTRGVLQNYLAGIRGELAAIEPDLDRKRRLLEEAVLSEEKCIELCNTIVPYLERMGDISFFASLQSYQDTYVRILTRLYNLTNKPEHLRKAIEISQKAIESASKLDMTSRMAESYWKIAKAQDIMGEHLKAAGNFENASESYIKAAEKISQLKDLYHDYASYMQAWSEIEKARYHHRRQEYGLAREHFEKAAGMHKSLRQWAYLAPNYSAWAQIEHSEDLSRREKSEEALQAFEQAARLFYETKKSLQTQFSKIENLDEKQMATSMMKATDLRHEYCTARIALEEAKILDKQGDHHSSSEKYGSAAEIFEKITKELDLEQDKKEIRFTFSLSRAWQKMTEAEAEASPELYSEASQLFEEAKEFSPNERAKMLALGHSRFCRALEAGTKFADIRDPTMHTAAVKHLESAANYYVKAGLENASEYAKATGLLFDAYAQMDSAKEERDPEKKARLYMMAEKVLQTSAGAYMKAEHPEKGEQVQRLLEKVREERELAVSLTEVLHAPTIVSTTTAFTTPTPTKEEAVGLERFDHANIQANVITSQKSLKVGDNFDLEIELVNAGKNPALLIKIEDLIPKGFELTQKPEPYRIKQGHLNMKGKRLDPLKTEEVRLVLKPTAKGVFPLKPKILYLDENGKYKTHEPEPTTISVKELGIKGWIKGER